MVTIIDYGMGNLRSVEKGFSSQGVEVCVTNKPDKIKEADGLVLPGVGAFGDCIKNLRKEKLIDPILDYIEGGKPFLGICLGLQALFEKSEESPGVKGLGLIKGKVVKFPFSKEKGLKVPQMGWNKVRTNADSEILNGIPENSWFYFVHSYYVAPEEDNLELLISDYGIEFTAGVVKDNIFASQFHPEKSADMGLRILKNFSDVCAKH